MTRTEPLPKSPHGPVGRHLYLGGKRLIVAYLVISHTNIQKKREEEERAKREGRVEKVVIDVRDENGRKKRR